MHIVIDARIRPSSTGRYTDRLLQHLQLLDKNNRYTVLLQQHDTWRPTAKNFTTLPCPYKQFSLNPLEQIGFAWKLYRLRPDLVHFTMTQQPLLYFGKIVTTTHDLTMLRFTRPGKRSRVVHTLRMAFYRFMFKWSHRKSRSIIVPSKFVRRDLMKLDPKTRNKITVTYEASEPPIKAKAQKPSLISSPFILHVGSPFPHKNIDRLIDAFDILHTADPTLHLVLAGKKEFYFEQLLAKITASSSSDNIHTTGFVSDTELKWLYENAECYALPSLSEGFGLPGLEAMAHGCALASSNATCLPEIYGDAALYFDPSNPRDIAAKIQTLFRNKNLRSQLVRRGHARLADFSWDQMAKQTLAVYKSAAR